MSPGLLARSRLLTGCACAVFVMLSAGAGCSTSTPAVTVTGQTLTIYVSAPSDLGSQAQDVVDAEKLAFNQLKGQVSGFTLNLRVLTNDKVSDNARQAIEDKTSVAYLGEVAPGASVNSIGITNAQDLLQVSPTPEASVPTKDFESFSTYGRTFASPAPGSDASTLDAESAGKTFAGDFRTSYGHAPSPQAIFGYVASAAVVQALHKAGSAATNRGTIRDEFFGLKNASLSVGPGGPALGTLTVNKDGTMTLTPAGG